MKTSVQERMFQIIFGHDTQEGKAFDIILIVSVLLSVLAVMLETVEPLWTNYKNIFIIVEWFFTLLFTLELILRLYCVKSMRKYFFSFYGMVDFLSILPTYLAILIPGAQAFLIIRTLRLLRIFRILKLSNYTSAGSSLLEAMQASKHKIIVFVFFVITMVCIVGAAMFFIEGKQAGFSSIPKSIYWAIVTMTTVGYGDIAPASALGQILSSLLMIIGYGIIAVPTGIITSEMSKLDQTQKNIPCTACANQTATMQLKYCTFCGRNLPTKTF